MDSTKNFFDAWVNTQTQLVDSIVDTSKKIQESFNKQDGGSQQASDVYSNWFHQQKDAMDTMLAEIKNKVGDVTPEFLQEWVSTQQKFTENWMTVVKEATENFSNENAGDKHLGNIKKVYEQWNSIYNQLTSQFGKPFSQSSYVPGDFTKDTFGGFVDSSRAYIKMFEIWQPIHKMMQSNTMGVDSLHKMVDMSKYQSVFDSVFHFMNPTKANMIVEQGQKIAEMIKGMTQGLFNDPMQQIAKMMPNGLMDKNFNVLADLNYQFTDQFYKFSNPYFTMIPPSREKEILAIMMRVHEKHVKYYIKSVEMQNLVYVTGQKSIEKVVKDLANRMSESTDPVTYDEFYSQWVNTLEDDMIELFAGNAFSKIQGDLLQIGLQIKTDLDKQMEHYLAPLPVVPRSEVDEMNATIKELKDRVQSLEKALETKAKAPRETAKKKPAAQKATAATKKPTSAAKSTK
ncbi:poly(R)-hydroxyalkanoic acid synthase subunit PhaE [uncultured Microscilla sp.]|uniref:poly(R)-hydroxyalkanoic acid synthase subunit PhaE n=1 Tax=uncultured Microscilla sp. TaxID=432653 RepID=UPI00262B2BE3|nr:poly(R)-hydroxyalkanoic acid synthase subunit PhaE [uncultured Microscilla sp.]